MGDAATDAIGDAAGALIDPRAGFQRARAGVRAPAPVAAALIAVAVALVAGFLLGRRSRR
jgi:hypothetical protein